MVAKHKCIRCKGLFPKDDMIIRGKMKFCTETCLLEYARTPIARKKVDQARHQERKDNYRPHQVDLTKRRVNEFIVVLDWGKPCICCNKPTAGKVVHAGHFKPVSTHPHLRFDPRNIHLQLAGCNLKVKHRRITETRMEEDYRNGLINRYGEAYVEWVESPDRESPEYTIQDFHDIRKIVNAEKRRLLRGEAPSRQWRSLDEGGIILPNHEDGGEYGLK